MEVIMKKAFLALFFLAAWSLVLGAQEEIQPNITSVPVRVTVDPSAIIGPIKPMNAVNNGPYIDDRGQMQDFRTLHIPFSRTHDANEGYYGRNLVDISAVFPDFSKDPDKPASYDFRETDAYIRTLVESGSEPFYRLGQTIENQTAAKYNIYPPKDYKKWASICEHIILHYNEGWAQGFHYNIRYWEIWNEADLDQASGRWKTEPRTWGAPVEEFHKLYAVAARHLKARFPQLKIGGPSYCRIQGTKTYFPQFFQYMRDNQVPIDFVSWHKYGAEPSVFLMEADLIRGWMKEYGYQDAELILNEWNYRRFKSGAGSSNERYNLEHRRSMKGAAFAAATMSALQHAPVDMMMYYDFRPATSYCGFYDLQTERRMPLFYVFYAWSKFTGDDCRCLVEGGAGDIYAVASARDGKTVLLLTRYDGDNNACNLATVTVSVKGRRLEQPVFGHLTDDEHLYTEVPLFPGEEEGTVVIELKNNAVALLEL